MAVSRLDPTCRKVCWAAAAVLAVICFFILLILFHFWTSLLIALAVFVIAGLFASNWLCSRGFGLGNRPVVPVPPAHVDAAGAGPGAAAAPAPAASPAPEPAAPEPAPVVATPAPAAAPAAMPAVDDAAVAGEGSKPAGLAAPRGGLADDLKKIEGIGPAMEKLCNELGIFHFDQIAAWGPAEVAWMNANLKGFKGRVSRDKWVAQARLIGTVGMEEFLRRAKTNDY